MMNTTQTKVTMMKYTENRIHTADMGMEIETIVTNI